MDFATALAQLVDAHHRELATSQEQIPGRKKKNRLPTTPKHTAGEILIEKHCDLALQPARRASFACAHLQNESTPRVIHVESFDASLSLLEQNFEYLESGGCRAHVLYRWESLFERILARSRSASFVVHAGWLQPSRVSEHMSQSITSLNYPNKSISMGEANSISSLISAHKSISIGEKQQNLFSLYEAKARMEVTQARRRHVSASFRMSYFLGIRSRDKALRTFTSTWVLHPASWQRRCWALVCLIVALDELFALTMAPFGIMDGELAQLIEWSSAIFLICDIVMNFHSGIYVDGVVEMRFSVIAKCYLRSWCMFDAIAASLQIVALLVGSETMDAFVVLRITREIRLARVGRILLWLKDVWDLSNVVAKRGKLLIYTVALYFFVHSFACLLYGIGKDDDGWVSHYKDRFTDSVSHNYLVSLHWSLSQLQGNVDIYPGAFPGTLLFVVLSSWCSIMALTLFVSNATDTLADVRQQEQNGVDRARLTQAFFLRHDIAPEIRARALHYLHKNKKVQSSVKHMQEDEEALQMFPPHLRSLLLTEMRSFALTWHPLFRYLQDCQGKIFVRLCSVAMSLIMYENNEDIFANGEAALSAYFALDDNSIYSAILDTLSGVACVIATTRDPRCPTSPASKSSQDSEAIRCDTQESKPFSKIASGQFVSEVSLWMRWDHVGDLSSIGPGQCFALCNRDLITSLARHPPSFAVFATFAQRFVNAAKSLLEKTSSNRAIELMNVHILWEVELDDFVDSTVARDFVDDMVERDDFVDDAVSTGAYEVCGKVLGNDLTRDIISLGE